MSPILIAGGGIGGVACAIALAARGISSHILERRQSFSEDGAGIQISPNAMGVLQRLGVAAALEPQVGKPRSIKVYGGSGRHLTSLPLSAWMQERFARPYWVAHRRDLQAALLGIARASPLIKISNGFAALRVEDTGKFVRLVSSDGEQAHGAALIAADGIWSTLRSELFPSAALTYSGKSAARAVVPATGTASPFKDNDTGVWMAPHFHVVHYRLRGGSEIAVIVVVNERWHSQTLLRGSWGAAVDKDRLMTSLKGAAPELRRFLADVPSWRKWPLLSLPALHTWSKGRIVLIGDAAHPVLPFLAQGGALALEDAWTLAAVLASSGQDHQTAFAAFERTRRHRVAKVQAASKRNGDIYHQAGLMAFARDSILRIAPPDMIMGRYDWLYRWRGPDAG